MKNGFVGSQDIEYNNQNKYHLPTTNHHSNGKVVQEEVNGRQSDQKMKNGHGFDNDGLHVRKSPSNAAMESPLSSTATTTTLKFIGAKDAFTTYDVLWCRTKSWIESMKHVPWKNGRAPPGKAYNPTEVEHVANVVTHGLWIVPALFAGIQLAWRSNNSTQKWTALVYGSALTLLFAVSTIFHCVHYCNKNRNLKDLLHRCDRAMIYIFIAGSYYPWLSLAPPSHPTILFITQWMVWILAGAGILYQQLYHERYKCLETCLYLVMGIGPSLVLILNGHHFKGMDELQVGGILYIVGICFFKADGKIPFAHAIWHLFVVVAAFIHYYAILKYLY